MLIRTLLLLVVTLNLAASSFAQSSQVERPWTLMIYGAADNNADGHIFDFMDSVRVALDNDPGMEIILFIDRSEGFSDDASFLGSNFAGAGVFRVRKDSCEVLNADEFFPGMSQEKEYEVDSADPRNIGSFIAFTKKNFPARKYGLMIYSHADGCSMCPDEESGNDMYIPQLTAEVDASASVDFMALELCNMSGVEIAYQWRPGNGGFSADVLVAIPNAGPPLDWYRAFDHIRSPGHASNVPGARFDPAELSPVQFGKLVIDEGYLGRLEMAEQNPEMADRIQHEAAACFNLTLATKLKQEIDAFARALHLGADKLAMEQLRGPIDNPNVMNYSGEGYRFYPYADLYDVARRAMEHKGLSAGAREAAKEICQTMESFVVSSFGMAGLEGFTRGKNGIFLVLPDAESWNNLSWYTPLSREEANDPYGNWAFLKDGAVPDNGMVDNWFELMDAWHDDTSDDPGGNNGYLW